MKGTEEELEADEKCNSIAIERAEALRASPRHATDARRAWRKMEDFQRREFMAWLADDETGAFDDNDQIR